GAVRAGRHAETGPGDDLQGLGPGPGRAAGGRRLQEAEFQYRAEQVARRCQGLARRRDQDLEGHHLAGEGRSRGIISSGRTNAADKQGGRCMRRFGSALVLCLAVTAFGAQAQDKFPSKPVKVVVPFGPGSATDIVMRIVGDQMRPILGQPVVIENKPGAFGILAIEDMARSRPDGYTLQIGNPGTNALAPIIYKKKFKIDYDKDVILVTRLSEVPLVLAATTKDFGPKTYAEFIAYAKANPGKVRYASVGIGSNNHYDTEAFAQWAGIELL